MKNCPKCSVENNDDQKFCVSCGTNLQSDLEKFLESQGISQLAGAMKAHDITSLEVLKELGENDLTELGLAYGDKVRIKVAIESLKSTPTDNKAGAGVVAQPSPQSVQPDLASLASQSRDLLRQAAQVGITRASDIISTAQQSLVQTTSTPSMPSLEKGEDPVLLADLEKTYTFSIWGWATCGILTLVAWWKIFSNRKKVHSELLKAHWQYQNKTTWMYVGIAILLAILIGIVDGESASKSSNVLGWLPWVWYIRMSWKGRKALKMGLVPEKLAVW